MISQSAVSFISPIALRSPPRGAFATPAGLSLPAGVSAEARPVNWATEGVYVPRRRARTSARAVAAIAWRALVMLGAGLALGIVLPTLAAGLTLALVVADAAARIALGGW